MRRVALTLVSTVAALVALLSFKTHSGGLTAPSIAAAPLDPAVSGAGTGTATGAATSNGAASPTTVPSSSSATGSATGSATASTATRTVTGASADTRWGPVQVRITVSGGKVTAAQAVVFPDGNGRDQEINSFAIPQLNQEAVAAGTAKIDSVSGATYTSDGYITSLQSALDQAGL